MDEDIINFSDGTFDPIGNENLVSLANGFDDGKWRYDSFLEFIWDNVQETALTKQERAAFIGRPMSILQLAARRLRISNDKGKGSELAEIMLYGVMRHYYNALPVVPKIYFKQNINDNAKGADSVHIVVRPDDMFEIWLGEAKFYTKIEDSNFESFIDSVSHTISKVAIEKESSIILGIKDLDDLLKSEYAQSAEALIPKIHSVLSPDAPVDSIRKILHVPILLIDQCEITKNCTDFDASYIEAIKEKHKASALTYFEKQIERLKDTVHLYTEVKFHLILFPVPDKETIVNRFLEAATVFRGSMNG